MNRILETLTTALGSLKANKIRAVLTMLGVIIGVFAVIALVSIGNGIKAFVTDQFSAIGSNLIFVVPGKVDFQDDPAKSFSRNKLEKKHLELITTYAGDYVAEATPQIRVAETVKYKTKVYYATVIATGENAIKVFNRKVVDGRYLSRLDINSNARVAVIGPLVASSLFGTSSPLGKSIKVSDDSYVVVGVLAAQNERSDDNVQVPYTTFQQASGIEKYSGIGIKLKDQTKVDAGINQIERALLRDLGPDDFSVLSQTDVLSSIQSILSMLTLGLGAVAGISLVVGGIGIMNIMLVSVTERTREIGLRKAVGANPFDIGIQFVAEAVFLSGAGGILGIIFGWLSSLVIKNFVQTYLPLSTILLAFGFSVAVGVVFGTYPAVKASKKDAIEALRYE